LSGGSAARERLRQWILEKSGKLAAAQLRDDTPILEQRILTSLQLPELILFLEELSGRPLDVSQLKPGVFRDVDTICRNFLGAA
jgi:hypothetical protein